MASLAPALARLSQIEIDLHVHVNIAGFYARVMSATRKQIFSRSFPLCEVSNLGVLSKDILLPLLA
jgi:hypothetical protein